MYNDFNTECSDGYYICGVFKGNGLKRGPESNHKLTIMGYKLGDLITKVEIC